MKETLYSSLKLSKKTRKKLRKVHDPFWTPAHYAEAPNATIATSTGNVTAVSNTRSGHGTHHGRYTGDGSWKGWDHLPIQPGAPGGCAFEEESESSSRSTLISAVLEKDRSAEGLSGLQVHLMKY